MDAVTAVSGSGPAYFALLSEAMIEAGILLGLSREVSTQLVIQTMLGTASCCATRTCTPSTCARPSPRPADDDPRDPRARAGRCPRGVPERDPGGDGAVAGARGRRAIALELDIAPDAEDAASRRDLVAAQGNVVLTGGTSPERAYELAADRRPDWSGTELWWGDERCVPPDHEWSNFAMEAGLLDRLRVLPPPSIASRASSATSGPPSFYDRELEGVALDPRAQRRRSRRTLRVALPRRADPLDPRPPRDRRRGEARALRRPRDDDARVAQLRAARRSS